MPRRSLHDRLPALLRAAAQARKQAWAPYSSFPVGAAVLAGGRTFVGCNVENSAYPLSVCAERNAIAAAVVAGNRSIDAIAVVGGNDKPSAPCGGCRQVLAEFGTPETPVVYAAGGTSQVRGGKRAKAAGIAAHASVSTTLAALLPNSFGSADLLKAAAAESKGSSRGPAGKRRSVARVRGTRSNGRLRSP
jgi:cytidine deaminase